MKDLYLMAIAILIHEKGTITRQIRNTKGKEDM